MLNRWQEEIRKLERADDTKMNREMFNIYSDTLKQVKAKLKDYMANYEDLPYWKQMQTGQLVKLQDEITELLNSAYPKAVDVATNFKTDQLRKGYMGVFYHAESQEGVSLGFNGLNKDFVRSAVQEPVAGKKLSQRLYKRREQLAKRAQGAITTAVLQGKGYPYMARIISANTDANYRHAMRIARTEGGRMRSIGKQKAYEEAEEMGINMQKMWVSTLDSMTRSSHQHLDGQVVDIKDDFIGLEGARAKGPRLFGDPSEDVNCRCTTVTVVNGVKPALRRDNETGEIIPYKSYKDWAKDRVKPVEESAGKVYNYIRESDMPKLLKSAGNIEPFEKVYVYADETREQGYIATPNSFDINKALYEDTPEKLSPWDKATIYHLDNVINRNVAPFDLMTDRWVGQPVLREIIKQNEVLQSIDDIQDLVEMISKEEISFLNKGYTSTSLVPNKNFFTKHPMKLEIKVPKGSRVFVTENYDESEMILPRNTIVDFESAEIRKGKVIVKGYLREEKSHE